MVLLEGRLLSGGLLVLSGWMAAGGLAGPALRPRAPVPEGYVAAPYYPTPYGGWSDNWSEAYAKAAALVSNMTLAEKTNITGGVGLWMGTCALRSPTRHRCRSSLTGLLVPRVRPGEVIGVRITSSPRC